MAQSPSPPKPWSLYIIRCGDRSLYTGISNDVAARFAVHQAGSADSAKYLRGRQPLALVYQAIIGSKSTASKAEYRVKKLSKRQKERLIVGKLSLQDLGIDSSQQGRI